MPDRNYDREQRLNNTGYWTDRGENDNREGDRSRSRNYDRGDQRRYGRQSQEQAERMRRLRGQGPDPRDREGSRGDRDHRQGDWNINRGDDSGYGERPMYQGYGAQIARNEGRYDDRNRDREDFRNRYNNRDRVGDRDRGQRGANYDYDYDYERDYRNNENTGRDMNLEGSGEPGRWQRDPYRNRGSYGYSGGDRSVEDESNWREEQDRARDNRGRARDDRGRDRQDNYWGQREQERRYDSGGEAWWDNTGGRPDYTSARSIGTDRDRSWSEGLDDEREYDMDPGYQYEFGTDFDFMRDTSLEEALRRQEREGRGRRQQSGRGQGGSGQQDRSRQEYGRQRESWNQPGPYSGMGPSGYQRSDERIQEEICEIFTNHGRLDARDIEIEVQSGQVTLRGDVHRKQEKYLAEDLAAQVTGVQDIENRIRVSDNEGARGMDRDNVAMPGRIQSGMRVAGVDGKNIGRVKETRANGFILERAEGSDTFIPFRAVKRTDGQIVLHVTGGEIDRQGWKES